MLLKNRRSTAQIVEEQITKGQITEQVIAERAYTLWQARGCPAGDGQEDWQDAKDQLAVEAAPRRKPLRRLFARFRNQAALT